jgi:hypothetical protein
MKNRPLSKRGRWKQRIADVNYAVTPDGPPRPDLRRRNSAYTCTRYTGLRPCTEGVCSRVRGPGTAPTLLSVRSCSEWGGKFQELGSRQRNADSALSRAARWRPNPLPELESRRASLSRVSVVVDVLLSADRSTRRGESRPTSDDAWPDSAAPHPTTAPRATGASGASSTTSPASE